MAAWTRMVSRGWLVAAISVCAGASAFAETPGRPMRHLIVTVNNLSGVKPHMLASAERIVSDVYRRAGIEIEWAAPPAVAGPDRLYVNLLSSDMAPEFSAAKDTAGFATPGSPAANVIYDRVKEMAGTRRLPCGLLLGYVMAHELGHLLLPAHSHSATGVMRATVDIRLAAEKKLRFSNDQAALMLERLTAAPVVFIP